MVPGYPWIVGVVMVGLIDRVCLVVYSVSGVPLGSVFQEEDVTATVRAVSDCRGLLVVSACYHAVFMKGSSVSGLEDVFYVHDAATRIRTGDPVVGQAFQACAIPGYATAAWS